MDTNEREIEERSERAMQEALDERDHLGADLFAMVGYDRSSDPAESDRVSRRRCFWGMPTR